MSKKTKGPMLLLRAQITTYRDCPNYVAAGVSATSSLPNSSFKPPSWNTSLLINYWINQPSIKTAHGWRWILEHGLVLSMHSLAHFCLARWVPHLLLFEGELPGIRVFLLTFVCIIPLLPIFIQFGVVFFFPFHQNHLKHTRVRFKSQRDSAAQV